MGEIKPAVLYDEDRVRITDWPKEPESHFLYVGDMERGYALQRGVLKDLGRRVSLESFGGSLDQVNPAIKHAAEMEGVGLAEIRLAFNQARIKELEMLASNFSLLNFKKHIE